jgi:hypothetical protein
MRQDNPTFALLNESEAKEPRFVISIEFEVESIYLTSHTGITGVPGVVIENVIQSMSSISQKIIPDEGRTEIGSFSFKLIDLNSAFTQEIQAKLADFQGLRDHRVRFYVGYANPGRLGGGGFGSGTFGSEGFGEGIEETLPDASFDEFQLFQTQDITGVKFKDGVYSIQCADITRESRKEIFEPKRTTLRDSITASSTTVPVYVTTGFTPIQHGPSFSDAPNSFVGYLLIDDEVIRYTAKTADSFTGCTRGVFNTKAVPHTVDITQSAEQRPKVEEMIYLEMPAPMMAGAILTGVLKYASGDYGLPDHWHLGIDTDLVRLSDFQNIGEDLWDTTNDTLGFIPAFQELKKTDGKKFLESELYQLIGCYSHVYYDGQLGLKRMNPVLIDAAGVVELNESNVVDWSDLDHDYKRVYNTIRVDWNWNGEEFTRTTLMIDAQSRETHGDAPIKQLKFKGLRGWRHSDSIIRSQVGIFRDRYTSPPEAMSVTVMPSLNRLEVGDIVRVKLNNVRDFAGNLVPIDRAFEIQRKVEDYSTGNVTLDLFGSTGRASADEANAGIEAVLPDEFYTSQGTELSTVATIVVTGGVGVIQAGSYTLNGHANANNDTAIFYYDGELELANGATLNLNQNVQLRHKGFFTINGAINGVGGGQAGVADVSSLSSTTVGLSGFIGNVRGMDGLSEGKILRAPLMSTRQARMTMGKFSSFPLVSLEVVDDELRGLPNDLRGTSGGPGEKAVRGSDSLKGLGGTGGDSGSGLILIGRGLALGASGSIDLSGDDSASTTKVDLGIHDGYPGAGAPGGPGSLLILVDGGDVSIPDIGGKFFALTGNVPINGNPITERGPHITSSKSPLAGFVDPAMTREVDLSNACHRIQYIPSPEEVGEDESEIPAAPVSLVVTGTLGANSIHITTPVLLENDSVEIYGSITNNRTDAVKIASGIVDLVSHSLATGATRYYWARVRRTVDGPDIFSDWYPESATAGVSAFPRTVDTPDIEDGAVTAILSTTAADTEISNIQHTPDGQGFNTQVVSLSYTPDFTGEVLVTVSGYADYVFDAAGTFLDLQYSLQTDTGYDGFQEQHWFISDPIADAQYFSNITLSRRFAVIEDVATVFKFMGAKFQVDDAVFMRNIELRLEGIKR